MSRVAKSPLEAHRGTTYAKWLHKASLPMATIKFSHLEKNLESRQRKVVDCYRLIGGIWIQKSSCIHSCGWKNATRNQIAYIETRDKDRQEQYYRCTTHGALDCVIDGKSARSIKWLVNVGWWPHNFTFSPFQPHWQERGKRDTVKSTDSWTKTKFLQICKCSFLRRATAIFWGGQTLDSRAGKAAVFE